MGNNRLLLIVLLLSSVTILSGQGMGIAYDSWKNGGNR